MQTTTLIILFILLVIILLILVIVYTAEPKDKAKKQQEKNEQNSIKIRSFNQLYECIKNKSTSEKELTIASEEVLKHYATITPKLGSRPHPDFNKYATMIMSLCRHPNTTKSIILHFDKKLQESNPSYSREIESFLSKGLNSRGL